MRCLSPIRIGNPAVASWLLHCHERGYFPTEADEERFLNVNNIPKVLYVPCGKCLYCFQRKQESWRIRLQQEQKDNFISYFCTLTYAPEFEPNEGVLKSDFQKFMKRFRHNMAIPVRFFAVSEYGPKGTHRPHYHFALFFSQYVEKEEVYQELLKSWHSIVHIDDLTDGRIQYLSTYCIKFFNEAPVGRNPNFMLCSRRPFIGSGFLNREMVKSVRTKMLPYISVNGFKKPLPRIYKEKIFDDEQKIILREKQNDFVVKSWNDYCKNFASDLDASRARFFQARRDYKRAWTRFKESKKL